MSVRVKTAKESDRNCSIIEYLRKKEASGVETIQLRCQRNRVILRGAVYKFYDSPFRIIYTGSNTDKVEKGDILEASNGFEQYQIEKVCMGNIQRYIITTPLHEEVHSDESDSSEQEG